MQEELRLPRVLDASLQDAARVHPLELSLELYLRACSVAKMSLPDGDPRLSAMPFTEIYTARGSAGIFRVYDSTEPLSGARSYTLRHAIDTLRDSVWREKTSFEGAMADYLAALLSWQAVAYWQLGVCADDGVYKRDHINYDHLDKLLDEVREARDGYFFAYDFTTTPWTLSFLAVSGSVDAEMRPSRNLNDASLRRTRNGMANRLLLAVDGGDPVQYDDAASQAVYGVSETTAEVSSEEVPDAAAWAAQFLADHAAPIASASADAFEIVKSTGEPWDAYDLGKLVRVRADRPGYPLILPLETLRYEGLAGAEPEKVRADLKKRLPKFSERLAIAQRKSDQAESAAETQQKNIDALDGSVARIDSQKAPKLKAANIFYLYVGDTQPQEAIQHGIVWIKPGATADPDGTLPCEVKYIQ